MPLDTVSYTHLDVYKRQVLSITFKGSSELFHAHAHAHARARTEVSRISESRPTVKKYSNALFWSIPTYARGIYKVKGLSTLTHGTLIIIDN